MSFNDSFLQELKYKIDIEDVISSYVSLKNRGNTRIGLCPFHNEKTPSFTVYPDTQSFYCFGCGAGGDVVRFISKIENLDYFDSIKLLADRAGLQMPNEGFDDSLMKKRRRILEINKEAARFYHSFMVSPEGKVGLDYFLNRGLTRKTINKFGLGYAPNEWDRLIKHLKSKGYSINEMVIAGLVKKSPKSYYDNFRNRAMTPIIDIRGNVIAFGGRVLDDSKPKYINTSDTIVYKKTNEVFGLNFAKDSGKESIILCEGYMDVIAMYQAGFTNAVAGCGTALTNEQVKLISRYASEVILAYDADEAGQKALNRSIDMFKKADIKIKVPVLQYGKDPDEIIKKVGAEKFGGMLEGATSELEFQLLKIRNQFDLRTTQGKIDFINGVVKVIAMASPVERDIYVSRISDELGIEKRSINAQIENYKNKINYRKKKTENKNIITESIRDNAKLSFDAGESIKKIKAEERLISLLFKYPDCYKLLNNFDENFLSEGFMRKVFSIISNNILNGVDNDFISFGNKLSDEEMDKLSGIIAKSRLSKGSKEEFCDCVDIITKEYEKENRKSASEMSDDDFRKLFS